MSSSEKCSEPGCSFHPGPSGQCSQHSNEGKQRTAAKREANAQNAARRAARLNADAAEWAQWTAHRPRVNQGQKTYLVMGASPDEHRRGRTHYDNSRVWLLGNEPKKGGVNYSRYIQGDYSESKAGKLRQIALENANRFDEITFDESSMCEFRGAGESVMHRFQSISIMLKPNGVLFLSDVSDEFEHVLTQLGFHTMTIRVRDLPGTIASMVVTSDAIVIVAIKGYSAGSSMTNTVGSNMTNEGGRRKTRVKRNRKTRHRNKKLSRRRYT